jgi:hypothetical protein
MHARNAPKMQPIDPRREHLLQVPSLTAATQQCDIEMSAAAASSSPSIHHKQLEILAKKSITDGRITTRTMDTGFYLPMSTLVDDNPTITVYDEVKEMLLSAILTYGVVHLRKLAKDKQDEATTNNYNTVMSSMLAEHLLTLPISAKEVVRLVSKYREDIVDQVGREATVDLYLTAFDDIQSSKSSRELELEMNSATSQISLVSFDICSGGRRTCRLRFGILRFCRYRAAAHHRVVSGMFVSQRLVGMLSNVFERTGQSTV